MSDALPHTLDGEWEVVACHIGGSARDANLGAKIVIGDGHIRDYHMPKTIVYEYEIDDSYDPKHMKWRMIGFDVDGVMEQLPMSVPSASGIYELVGNELRFCWSNPSRPFPRDFTSSRDADCHTYVYRRIGSE